MYKQNIVIIFIFIISYGLYAEELPISPEIPAHVFSRYSSDIVDIDFILKNRLAYFAMDLENGNWYRLLNYFDTRHLGPQMGMYLYDDFMFAYLGPSGERDLLQVIKLYMHETLSLYSDNSVDDLDQIDKVFIISITYNNYGDMVLNFSVKLKDNRYTEGRCYINPETYLLFGAFG